MAVRTQTQWITAPLPSTRIEAKLSNRLRRIPWWMVGLAVIVIWTAASIQSNPNFAAAFNFIKAGLMVTGSITLGAFVIALVIGLGVSIMRLSGNTILENIATFYIELIRGIPMMVLIFFIALVAVPQAVDGLNAFGVWLTKNGFGAIGGLFLGMNGQKVPMDARAITALALTYGAFLAEIFRAGIQSIPKGQMEAARALGLTYTQALRYVILPQAIKNVLPALGNDFISMLKDSSLVSILAVRDITQISRLYASSTFRFNEAYTILAVFYLVMTVALSLLVKWLEKRMAVGKTR